MMQTTQRVAPVLWLLLSLVASPATAAGQLGWRALGHFELTSGSAVVSDPCYPRSDKLSIGGVLSVKPGKWSAAVHVSDEKDLGQAVSELLVVHEAAALEKLTWVDAGFIVGVDSGTAGVFDEPHYRDDSALPRVKSAKPVAAADALEPGEAWYERYVVAMKGHGQLVPFGVISRSGFGDGGYRCLIARGANGKVEGIRIVFIGEGEDGEKLRARIRELMTRPSPFKP